MAQKRLGRQTVKLENPPAIIGCSSTAGKKESEGPLGDGFDYVSTDSYWGEDSWEKAESGMQKQALELAVTKANTAAKNVDYIFGGDLLNQCIGSVFGLAETNIPFYGIYGACSTMAEGLGLAAMMIDGGFADITAAVTSSHFCTAERQFRFPLEYGGQSAPSSQWTVTGSGAVILSSHSDKGPYITHVTTGKIVDYGITDAANMGAAMAPSAYDTLSSHFKESGFQPTDYDLIVTGDLGSIGRSIVLDFFKEDNIDLSPNYNDCGLIIFSKDQEGINSGGSGCGCSAIVLTAHILKEMSEGKWNRVLFAGTGALMSTTSSQQGSSIPGICHAVTISNTK